MLSKKKFPMLLIAALGAQWGDAAQAEALLPGGEARILEVGECQAHAQYGATRAARTDWRFGWPLGYTERGQQTTAAVNCGVSPRWQLGLEGMHQDSDAKGYGRGLRLEARFGLLQNKDQALSLGVQVEGLRRSDVPGSVPGYQERFRFSGLGFNLRGEQRLGDTHRLTAEFTQSRERGGDSGPWTATAGYGYRVNADWELLSEVSKAQRRELQLGLGVRWSPIAAPWSVGLMIKPEGEQDGARTKGARLSASYKF